MQFLRALATYILTSALIAAVILALLALLGPTLRLVPETIHSSLPLPATNTPAAMPATFTPTPPPTGTLTLKPTFTPPPTSTPLALLPTFTPTPVGFHPSPTSIPTTPGPTTPVSPTASAASAEEELRKIDQALSQSMPASLAFNAPQTMVLDDTATIELLLNPSASPTQVGGQVTAGGQVVTATIEITPRMQAELIAADMDAFVIRAIHMSAEQLVGSTHTTRWAWLVTARKSGPQKLMLVVYRLVRYEGKDEWLEVQSYNANIHVNVTLGQRIEALDWKWIGATAVTALLIPGFWRWVDSRKSKEGKKKGARRAR